MCIRDSIYTSATTPSRRSPSQLWGGTVQFTSWQLAKRDMDDGSDKTRVPGETASRGARAALSSVPPDSAPPLRHDQPAGPRDSDPAVADEAPAQNPGATIAVSYTHLDVYKRQVYLLSPNATKPPSPIIATPEATLWLRRKRTLDRSRVPIGAAKETTSRSAVVFSETDKTPSSRNWSTTRPRSGLTN